MQKSYFFIGLLILFTTPWTISQEDCDAASRTEREESINIFSFLAVLTVEIPESCGNFTFPNLLQCRSELNVIDGCCMDSCRELLRQYDATCLQDITVNLCQNSLTDAVGILDLVAARCDDDYQALSCDATSGASDQSFSISAPSVITPSDIDLIKEQVDLEEAESSAPEIDVSDLEADLGELKFK